MAGLLAASVAGCGGSDTSSAERVDRCAERLVQGIQRDPDTTEHELRRYAELGYCAQFEQSGLVYDDGALEIGVQELVERSGSEECETAGPGGSSMTVPCDELRSSEGRRTIDCALLRHVRESEVRKYLDDVQSRGEVECDDGTPLAELGVP